MKMPAGQLRNGNTAVEGKWKVPYLAEENADEDPEIQFLTSSESDATRKAKAVLHSLGKKASPLSVCKRRFCRISEGMPSSLPCHTLCHDLSA